MIEDLVERDFHPEHEDLAAANSPKQIELAANFQRDISGATRPLSAAPLSTT